MNKDELLKIYSAYLPYKTEVQTPCGQIRTLAMVDAEENCVSMTESNGMCSIETAHENGSGFKMILYDLSYLTREIEHEGVKKILAKELFAGKWKEISEYYVNTNQILKLSYECIQALLKHHFNVFNLPESEYINKATLTNK